MLSIVSAFTFDQTKTIFTPLLIILFLMKTIAESVVAFNKSLSFTGVLPKGINLLNPFKNNPAILKISEEFYGKYYNDTKPRRMILGINPGRHGAGVTGIPFSDTKRLKEFCGINITQFSSHELSSVFIYDMIMACGGVRKFYNKFYINSICPLGFTSSGTTGTREKNYNYYDSPALYKAMYPFIVKSIRRQIAFGFSSEVCYCMGMGTNYKFFRKINENEKLFNEIIPLEHPRFIMQYRLKKKDEYIKKYLEALKLH